MGGALALWVLLAAPAEPVKLASPEFNTVNVTPDLARFAGEHLATRLLANGIRVVTPREIATLLGLERQKQLLGCAEDASACMTELGNALGADGVILGDLAKLGKKLQLNLKVTRSSDGSVLAAWSGATEDEGELPDLLDRAAGALAQELLLKLGRAPAPVVATVGGVRRFSWIPGAVGLAGLGASALCFGLAIGQHNQLATGGQYTLSQANRLAQTGQTEQTIAAVTLGVGAAALVTAGAMFLLGKPSEVQPVVTLAPGQLGLAVGGAW